MCEVDDTTCKSLPKSPEVDHKITSTRSFEVTNEEVVNKTSKTSEELREKMSPSSTLE